MTTTTYIPRVSSRRGSKTSQKPVVKQYHTMNALDVPHYDNGYGTVPREHRKTVYIDAGPTLPYTPKRTASINQTPRQSLQLEQQTHSPARQISLVRSRAPTIRQPTARPKSQRVSYLYTDEDLIPPPLQVNKMKTPPVIRSHMNGPAPGMYKYVNKSLPPLPVASKPSSSKTSTRHIRRIDSRSELLANYANRPNTSGKRGQRHKLFEQPEARPNVDVRGNPLGFRHGRKVTEFQSDICSPAHRKEVTSAAPTPSRYGGFLAKDNSAAALGKSKKKERGQQRFKARKSACVVM